MDATVETGLRPESICAAERIRGIAVDWPRSGGMVLVHCVSLVWVEKETGRGSDEPFSNQMLCHVRAAANFRNVSRLFVLML